MNPEKINKIRYLTTGITVVISLIVLVQIWNYYNESPWTRDGKIKSDVIALAPDVSGRVTEVFVHDNQAVHKGDVLFQVDKERLQLAFLRARATMESVRAAEVSANREAKRYEQLAGVVSEEIRMQKITLAEQARANFIQAESDKNLAYLNLSRSEVKAPVDGIVTNFSLRVGAFVNAGVPVTAFVATDNFYVVGYFEENKISRIHTGDSAIINVMGEKRSLNGVVESISAGIEDRERSTSGGTMLANVNPTFNWVRLPQRVPVRISLKNTPKDLVMISGRTATVSIIEKE